MHLERKSLPDHRRARSDRELDHREPAKEIPQRQAGHQSAALLDSIRKPTFSTTWNSATLPFLMTPLWLTTSNQSRLRSVSEALATAFFVASA